jgi:hypothetical protein
MYNCALSALADLSSASSQVPCLLVRSGVTVLAPSVIVAAPNVFLSWVSLLAAHQCHRSSYIAPVHTLCTFASERMWAESTLPDHLL